MDLLPVGEGLAASPREADVISVPAEHDCDLSWPVRSSIQHMALNYSEPVTLGDLSRMTKLSAYQIIRAFRRELGITPHAWLIRHRVRMGTNLLKEGESIATVASEVGFADQTHFTRHFKRVHGNTPARFLTAEGSRTIHARCNGSSLSRLSPGRTHQVARA